MNEVVKSLTEIAKEYAKFGFDYAKLFSHDFADIVRKEISNQRNSGNEQTAKLNKIKETKDRIGAATPSNFQLIYTSKDGKYCLFETKQGHLVSADSSKFV